MNTQELAEITTRLIPTVVHTAPLTLPYFKVYIKRETSFETKADDSPVTEADKQTERFLRAALQRDYPDFGIIGEEDGAQQQHARYVWIIDPIDGTRTFIHGVPLYTTLVGLLDTHLWTPLLGCIYAPATEELVYAYAGGGAHFLHISKQEAQRFDKDTHEKSRTVQCDATTTKLETSLLLSYDWMRAIEKHPQTLSLMKSARITRTWADGYAYLLLSSARAQGVFDVSMNLWDIIPVCAVAQEAGAVISTVEGTTLAEALPRLYDQYRNSQSARIDLISCANKALHQQVLQHLR